MPRASDGAEDPQREASPARSRRERALGERSGGALVLEEPRPCHDRAGDGRGHGRGHEQEHERPHPLAGQLVQQRRPTSGPTATMRYPADCTKAESATAPEWVRLRRLMSTSESGKKSGPMPASATQSHVAARRREEESEVAHDERPDRDRRRATAPARTARPRSARSGRPAGRSPRRARAARRPPRARCRRCRAGSTAATRTARTR